MANCWVMTANEMLQFLHSGKNYNSYDYGVRAHCWSNNSFGNRYRCSAFEGGSRLEIVHIVTANERKQIRIYCFQCQRSSWSGVLPKRYFTGEELDSLRIERTNDPNPLDQCERCHKWARCQVHHWAPSCLFEDSYEWPTSVLCDECHVRWHLVTATNRIAAEKRKGSQEKK